MKKTSTRLATLGIVIVLGAFAIALAQHDARNRERDEPVVNEFAGTQAVPISVDGQWDRPGLVRANNDGFPHDPLLTGESGSPMPAYGEAESGLPSYGDYAEPPGENPLRGTGSYATSSSEGSAMMANYDNYELLPESEVVQAAGEMPAGDQLGSPPPWLAQDKPAGALPALPPTGESGLLDVPTFPSTDPSRAQPSVLPATNGSTPGSAPSMPSFPITPVREDTRALPQLPPSGATSPAPAVNGNSAIGSYPQAEPAAQSNQASSGNQLGNTNEGLPSYGSENAAQPYDASATLPVSPIGSMASQNQNAFLSDTPPTAMGNPNTMQPSGRMAAAVNASLVSNQPGNRYLDGSQSPILQIQKRAPEEIQVGKKATFVMTVRNAGNATAHAVTVVDSVPRGARFEGSSPTISPDAKGILKWELGEMAAGDERTISLQITPESQGEMGSVATVYSAAQASVRTIATLPKLEISMESLPEIMIGSAQSIIVTIKNTGTGVAKNVRIQADIPPQLRHESGESELDAPIGDLRPHEVIQRTLSAAAVQAGQAQCVFRAVTDDGVQAESAALVDVRAPQLAATIQGPTLRYLERQATYRVTVQNTGTAAATDLEFLVRLPSGLKYVSTTPGEFSEYNPDTHSVTLGLKELPAGEPAPFEITVLPVELGPQVITFAATGDLGVTAEARGQVMVEGLAELAFTIGQDNGTIETGATSTYSVQVTNIGNKPDKDVQLLVQLPNGAELVNINAPGVDYRVDGNKLVFTAIPEMKNRDQRTFQFEVRHNQAGNQIVRTQLTSQNWPVAVVKEEGTLVYNDQN